MLTPTGTFTPLTEMGGSLLSQYSRAADTPVLVSQNSVMLSRMSSRVRSLGPLETLLEDLLDEAGLTAPVAVVEHERREIDR